MSDKEVSESQALALPTSPFLVEIQELTLQQTQPTTAKILVLFCEH